MLGHYTTAPYWFRTLRGASRIIPDKRCYVKYHLMPFFQLPLYLYVDIYTRIAYLDLVHAMALL
jgi:hypothetical protein